jgi:hypothetical protein
MEKDILPQKAIDPTSIKDVAAMGEETPQQLKQCYQCGHGNTDQTFCGACGSPLHLNDYIAKKVKDQLAETIQNRDAQFIAVCSWLKLVSVYTRRPRCSPLFAWD